ncbi:MAG: CorA family divalent cation transporter [Mycoplasmoidaceae bacterium]
MFLVDLEDHITIVYDTVENLFIKGNELIQLYHTTIRTGMNEIMKVLTMISTIFIPLSFLVGLYGMNFETIPELQWKYGYFLLLGVLFSIVGSMAYFFKKKKWW